MIPMHVKQAIGMDSYAEIGRLKTNVSSRNDHTIAEKPKSVTCGPPCVKASVWNRFSNTKAIAIKMRNPSCEYSK